MRALAFELRRLRVAAGSPTYREMARRYAAGEFPQLRGHPR